MPDEALERSLRRIELLASELDGLADPVAREHARELLELVLDLHGLGLARMLGLLARADPALVARLAQDPAAEAVLLLHGLHPDDAETRVRRAIADLPVRAVLVGVSRRRARLEVEGGEELRAAVEDAVLRAAPELDSVEIAFEAEHVG
jgi:hypothetical protein